MAATIVLAVQGMVDGEIDLTALGEPEIPLNELRQILCKNRGIGFTVANGIALFGLGLFDAFSMESRGRQYMT